MKRADMDNALKQGCVPLLRELGFKGSLPNLYRNVEGFVSLVNFQFFSSGGSFASTFPTPISAETTSISRNTPRPTV